MSFDDLLAQLRGAGNTGDSGLPESIYDDLAGEYGRAVEGGAFALAEKQALLDQAMAENAKLKAMNFDLMVSSQGLTVVEEEAAQDADVRDDDGEDDEDGSGGVSSLFGKDDE